MIKFNDINTEIDMINMPERTEKYNKSDDIQLNISQHELMNAIHQEFQRSFIRKLYPHLEWTDRIFWAVTGTIQHKYYNELSLNQIIEGMRRYLTEHKIIIPMIKEVN